MRQVCIWRYGPPEVLRVEEVATPPLAPSTVRINVQAIGINFADVMARQGLYPDCPKPPVVVGYEVAGTVEAVATDVADLSPEQPVVALTRFGGYAEQVVTPVAQVFPLPDGMSSTVAAALPVNYLTAYVMLYLRGNLQPGEHVLIHNAGGGVGLAAVQLSRLRQAVIYGTASASKHAMLRQQGVQHPIDYHRQDVPATIRRLTAGRGVDLVLDPLGGHSFAQSYHLLAPLGRLVVFGASRLAGTRRRPWRALWHLLRMPRFHPVNLMNQNRTVIGLHLGHLWNQTAMLRQGMHDLLELSRQHHIAPVIARTFPLEEAADAHRYLQERRNIGKVLLTTS